MELLWDQAKAAEPEESRPVRAKKAAVRR